VRVAYTVEQCWHAVPGGTAVAALGMARALTARPAVELVGVSAFHRHPPAAAFAPPVPVRALPLPRRALYEAWRRLGWPPVERAAGPVDVVHATTILVPPRKAAPLVVTVHDLAFRHDPGSFTRHGVAAFSAGLARIRAHADLVLCSSQATLDDAAAAGVDPARLRLVPLGLDPVERPSPIEVDTVRRRLGLADRPYLLFVGTVEPRKNLPRLLEAYRSLDPPQQLVLVGPDGWGDVVRARRPFGSPRADVVRARRPFGSPRADVVRARRPFGSPRAERSPLAGERWLGFVDEATKAALYEGADAVCYPSLREGFGLPVLEAMAHGAPVVTSRGTATAEVGGDAVVLVDPLDVADIAHGITEAIDRRDELSVAGPRRAARFTWAATAEAVLAAYREVAA
jgi:glycosyltransferase involved in cell wall biosynthesis